MSDDETLHVRFTESKTAWSNADMQRTLAQGSTGAAMNAPHAAQSIAELADQICAQLDSSRLGRFHQRLLAYPALAHRTVAAWLATAYVTFMKEVCVEGYITLARCGPQTYAEYHMALGAVVGMEPDPQMWETP